MALPSLVITIPPMGSISIWREGKHRCSKVHGLFTCTECIPHLQHCSWSKTCSDHFSYCLQSNTPKLLALHNLTDWIKQIMQASTTAPIHWLLVSHRLPAWIFRNRIYHHYYISTDVTLNKLLIGIMSLAINVTLTNVSVCCTASKRTTLRWRIMTNDNLAITFVNFFCEKHLLGE